MAGYEIQKEGKGDSPTVRKEKNAIDKNKNIYNKILQRSVPEMFKKKRKEYKLYKKQVKTMEQGRKRVG